MSLQRLNMSTSLSDQLVLLLLSIMIENTVLKDSAEQL